MIRITLYANCLLTDNYKNVFSMKHNYGQTNTPFSDYLASLYSKSFDIDNVYQDEMTSLNFKLDSTSYGTYGSSLSIYTFNYMKIQSIDDENNILLTRYAFINSIKIGNDIAQVSFKIDIWHSFSLGITGINYSLLKGLRLVNGNIPLPMKNAEYFSIPIKYSGNNKVVLPSNIKNPSDSCIIIAQVQFYKGNQIGEPTTSWIEHILIYDKTIGQNPKYYTYKDLNELLQDLFSATQVKKTLHGFVDEYYYFTIGNLYILPAYSALIEKFYTASTYYEISRENSGVDIHVCWYRTLILNLTGVDYVKPFSLKTYTFNNNFKTVSFGNLTTRIDIVNNGTGYTAQILCSISNNNFNIFMNVQNKYYDITKDFYYEPIVNFLSGSTIAQQRTSRELQDNLTMINYIKSGTNILGNMGNDVLEIGGKNTGSAVIDLSGNIMNLGLNFSATYARRQALFAPEYNYASIVKANNVAILNARYEFFEIQIDSENDNFVKDSINNLGYNVFEYVNNWGRLGIINEPQHFINSGIYYNTIQFAKADVYGSFPDNIANLLNKILENGIKIWYYHDISYALEHDTYVVG